MVVQLWHTGRVSHTSFQKDGQAPVGPSAIRANTKTFVAGQGFVDVSMPRALELKEILASSLTFATPVAAPLRPDSTAWSCTALTDICLMPFCATEQTIEPTLMAAPSRTAQDFFSRSPRFAQKLLRRSPRRSDIPGLNRRRFSRQPPAGSIQSCRRGAQPRRSCLCPRGRGRDGRRQGQHPVRLCRTARPFRWRLDGQ